MSLEEEIQQKEFPNGMEKALINVIFTSGHFHSLNVKRFKPYGISPEQFNVLRILRGSHPKKLRLSDISSRMLDKSSNATRLVEKLRAKGLVTRVLCNVDRRQVDVGITKSGLSLLSEIDLTTREWFEKTKHLNEEETTTLNFLLDKMRG